MKNNQYIGQLLAFCLTILISSTCFSQDDNFKRTISYKQLFDEIRRSKDTRIFFESVKVQFKADGEDSVFARLKPTPRGYAYVIHEIKNVDFPVSVVFQDCAFESDFNFNNCKFKNLEFDASTIGYLNFDSCYFAGNLVFLNKSSAQIISVENSIFKRAFHISESTFGVISLTDNTIDSTLLPTVKVRHKFNDFFLFDTKPIPINITKSKVEKLHIESNDFAIPNQDSIITLQIMECSVENFLFKKNKVKSASLRNTAFNSSIRFDSIHIINDLYVDNIKFPADNANISWDYLKGNKICIQVSDKRYKAFDQNEMKYQIYFDDFMSSYNKFYQMYKVRADRVSANGCYVEMKDIETRRLKFHYGQDNSLKRWFNWKLNEFLKFFCDYGTNPVKSLIISM